MRGYTVVDEADGGTTGLAKLARGNVDLVILDLTMADMDGIEVIRRVRQSGSGVPIILSSGHLDAQSERGLTPNSFQAFLRKPYRMADLLAGSSRLERRSRLELSDLGRKDHDRNTRHKPRDKPATTLVEVPEGVNGRVPPCP